mmetsp:Transcript_49984/g.161577  ORF Transcript_49984/g.161577 Transcript_49984/m.161577 type:complete len:261 (+) Transcript_49984:418-1200(+)
MKGAACSRRSDQAAWCECTPRAASAASAAAPASAEVLMAGIRSRSSSSAPALPAHFGRAPSSRRATSCCSHAAFGHAASEPAADAGPVIWPLASLVLVRTAARPLSTRSSVVLTAKSPSDEGAQALSRSSLAPSARSVPHSMLKQAYALECSATHASPSTALRTRTPRDSRGRPVGPAQRTLVRAASAPVCELIDIHVPPASTSVACTQPSSCGATGSVSRSKRSSRLKRRIRGKSGWLSSASASMHMDGVSKGTPPCLD